MSTSPPRVESVPGAPAQQAAPARAGVNQRAVLMGAAGIAVLSTMDAVIKEVAARYPTFEVVFVRYLFGAIAIVLVALWKRPGWPSWGTVRANVLRAILGLVTATTFFYALGVLPLAETLALSFLSPIFMATFAALILRERVDARVILALAAGFLGMLVIVGGKLGSGSLAGAGWGVVAALLSAVTYALSIVMLRARALVDPVITIVLIQNIGPLFMLGVPAAVVWQQPVAFDWALFAVIGTLGTTGHLLMANAFARAEAARLAPLEYTALIWAVGLGLVFFGEVPTVWTLSGAGLIIAGAVIASRR